MAKLTAKRRNALANSKFAGPDRTYPVDTRGRAANAKARASQQYNTGNLSASSKAKIDAKANRILGTSAQHAKAAQESASANHVRTGKHG